jgi:outer membrane protein OmpA-like peptidoglycan-associated protein
MKIFLLVLLLLFAECSKKVKDNLDFFPEPIPPIVETVTQSEIETDMIKNMVYNDHVLMPIFETIYFDFDSYKIKEAELVKLNNIIRDVGERDVMLIGACCPIGNENYNNGLGYKRAGAVKEKLQGVYGKIIEESIGETQLVSETNYSLNRRCEIHIK